MRGGEAQEEVERGEGCLRNCAIAVLRFAGFALVRDSKIFGFLLFWFPVLI